MFLALICTLLIGFFSFHTYQSIQMLKTKISLVKIGLLYTKSLQTSNYTKLLNPCSPAADPGAIIETSFDWLPYLGAGVAVLFLVGLSFWFCFKGNNDSGDLPPSLESINKLFDEGVYVKAAERIPPRRDPSEFSISPEKESGNFQQDFLSYMFGQTYRKDLDTIALDEVVHRHGDNFVKVISQHKACLAELKIAVRKEISPKELLLRLEIHKTDKTWVDSVLDVLKSNF